MEEEAKCSLCGETIHGTITHVKGKDYCGNTCYLYDTYPTQEQFLRSKENGHAPV